MNIKTLSIFIGLLLLVAWQPAMSAPIVKIPDLAEMLKNLSKVMPELMRLVTAFAYVAGFFLIIKGIFACKHFGEQRSMMSREHSLMGPISYLFAGAALIYLPSSVHVGLTTLFGDPTPFSYAVKGNPWREVVKDAFLVIELIGAIAIIKGLLMLAKIGSHQSGGQQISFGKAMSHIIGGLLCINMYATLTVVWNTLGMGIS